MASWKITIFNSEYELKTGPFSIVSHVSLPKGTLDGSEIRRYNQLRLGYLPLFTSVLYIPGGDRRISSINSRECKS